MARLRYQKSKTRKASSMAYNFDGKPIFVKKLKNLPDFFGLKGKWMYRQATAMLPQSKPKKTNIQNKVDTSADSITEFSKYKRTSKQHEDKEGVPYYEYIRQLSSLKVTLLLTKMS